MFASSFWCSSRCDFFFTVSIGVGSGMTFPPVGVGHYEECGDRCTRSLERNI